MKKVVAVLVVLGLVAVAIYLRGGPRPGASPSSASVAGGEPEAASSPPVSGSPALPARRETVDPAPVAVTERLSVLERAYLRLKNQRNGDALRAYRDAVEGVASLLSRPIDAPPSRMRIAVDPDGGTADDSGLREAVEDVRREQERVRPRTPEEIQALRDAADLTIFSALRFARDGEEDGTELRRTYEQFREEAGRRPGR